MNFKKPILLKLLCISIASLVCIIALGSCGISEALDDLDGNESTTEDPNEVVEHPRFDYFSADMADYVKFDTDDYKDLVITISSDFIISDEEVKEYIDTLRFNNKTVLNDGAKVVDEAIKKGDTAYIFYEGTLDGKAVGSMTNMADDTPTALSVGSNTFIPGFEDGLIDVVPNQTGPGNMLKLNLTFPEEYNNEDLAGEEVVFEIWVVYSVQYQIPEYTEDFITDTLEFEAEGDDVKGEFEEEVKAMIDAESESVKKSVVEDKIWELIFDKATILEYPQDELDYYYNSYVDQLEYYMQYYSYMGMAFDDFDDFARQYMNLDEDADWEKELEGRCENMVSRDILTHAISQFDNLPLTDKDFDAEVERLIEYYNQTEDEEYTADDVVEMLGEDHVKNLALYSKIFAIIEETCTIEYED